jgi:hypothetical protein
MDDSADELRPRPIEDVLPSAELLAHYKGRIGEIKETAAWPAWNHTNVIGVQDPVVPAVCRPV